MTIEKEKFETSSLLVTPMLVRLQVEQRLRDSIVAGVFAPEEHLSDRLLCETFGTSRSVVREAIRLMEAEGLVVQVPNRGPFVATLSLTEAEEIYEVRAALEAIIGASFVRHSTKAELNVLKAALARFRREALGQARRQQLLQLKREFYETLSLGSRSNYATRMLRLVLNRTSQLRAISMSAPERLPSTLQEMQAIITAIEKGEPAAAAKACRDHVRRAASVALRELARTCTIGSNDALKSTPSK